MQLLFVVCFAVISGQIRAADRDVDFRIEKKKESAEKSDDMSTTVKSEKWRYEVHMTNKAFRDLLGVRVDYIVFFNEVATTRGKVKTLRKESGSYDVGTVPNSKTTTFNTEAVELTKTQLKAGWITLDGSRPRAADTLAGIWIKVYEGETLLAEYSNPASLRREEKFGK